jgi:hypothetical protein
MRYELWEADDEDGTTGTEFFAKDEEHEAWRLHIQDRGFRLSWSVEAEDWNEAMTLLHVHQGLEPYKPVE